MKTSVKAIIIFPLFGIVVNILGLGMYLSIGEISTALEKQSVFAEQVVDEVLDMQRSLHQYLRMKDDRSKAEFWVAYEEFEKYAIEENEDQVELSGEKVSLNESEKEVLLQISDHYLEYGRMFEQATTASISAELMSTNSHQLMLTSEEMLNDSIELYKTANKQVENIQVRTRNYLFAFLGTAFLAAMSSMYLVFGIVRPLIRINKVLDGISKGDLTQSISDSDLRRKDEAGDLARAFDRTIVSLKLAMGGGIEDSQDESNNSDTKKEEY